MELGEHPVSSSGCDSCSPVDSAGVAQRLAVVPLGLASCSVLPLHRDTEWTISATLQSTTCGLIRTVTSFLLTLEQRSVICSS